MIVFLMDFNKLSCPTCRKEFVKPPKAEEIKKQKKYYLN